MKKIHYFLSVLILVPLVVSCAPSGLTSTSKEDNTSATTSQSPSTSTSEDLTTSEETLKTYTVTFDTRCDEIIKPIFVKEGGLISDPLLAREGYCLLYWKNKEDIWNFNEDKVTSDITLVAYWEACTYKVTFDPGKDAKMPNDQYVYNFIFDSEVTLPIPSKKYHTFVNWNYKNEVVNNGKWKLAEDITLTATWEVKKFKYTLKNNTSYEEHEINQGDVLTLPDLTSDTGAKFLGWKNEKTNEFVKSGTVYEFDYDLVLIAVFERGHQAILHSNGGELISKLFYVPLNKSFKLPVPDYKDKGKFLGWYDLDSKRQITDELGNSIKAITEEDNLIFNLFAKCEISVSTSEELLNLMSYDDTHAFMTLNIKNDIDLANAKIKGFNKVFYSTINGENHSISNFELITTNYYAGFINWMIESRVENLKLVNAIYNQVVKDKVNIGMIVGYAITCTFYNCSASGSLKIICHNSFDRNEGSVGGLIGFIFDNRFNDNNHAIANLTSEISIDTSFDNVGGIIGKYYCVKEPRKALYECKNLGDIIGVSNVGGLIGYASAYISDVSLCSNSGNIKGNNNVGGVIGQIVSNLNEPMNFNNLTNTGLIIISDYGEISGGGIIALAKGNARFYRCRNKGSITLGKWLKDHFYSGGIVGYTGEQTSFNGTLTTIEECSNEGEINGMLLAGGLAGKVYENIKILRSFNTGYVNASQYAGGLVSKCNALHIENSYNTGTVKAIDCAAGFVAYASYALDKLPLVEYSYNVGDIYSKYDMAQLVFLHMDVTTFKSCLGFGDMHIYDNQKGRNIYSDISSFSSKGISSYYHFNIYDTNNNKVNDKLINNEGHSIYLLDDQVSLFNKSKLISDLGYDETIWNLDKIDFTNKVGPTLK